MAKETFQRTKPHVNIGTIGYVDRSKSMIVPNAAAQESGVPRFWPSPHKSTPQITAKGWQQKGIMYPGARTVAGVRNVGLGVAGAVIPGGSIISNAIGSALGGFGTLSGGGLMTGMMSQNMQFLVLQKNLQKQSRYFQSFSNAMKGGQDVKSGSIRNTR